MEALKKVYELIDISSASEDEEMASQRTSTLLPKPQHTNYRVVLEISHSSAGAVADNEEYFDISAESLKNNCKRMRLNSSLESLDMEEIINEKMDREHDSEQEFADSPESPDPSLNSDVFIVEKPNAEETSSIASNDIARFVGEATVGGNDSYFETPPGPLRRWEEPNRESLNDLNEERGPAVMPLFRDNAADPNVY